MLFLTRWAGSTATIVAGGFNAWGGEYGDQKSIYDPCPAGWRVHGGKKTSGTYASPWSTWLTNTSTTGINTAYAVWASTIGYYPLSGYRDNGSGAICAVGSSGYHWSATVGDYEPYSLNLGSSNAGTGDDQPYGYSVRCVKVW